MGRCWQVSLGLAVTVTFWETDIALLLQLLSSFRDRIF